MAEVVAWANRARVCELAVEEAEGRDGAVDAPKEAGRGSVLPKE